MVWKSSIVTHTCSPSPWEVETRGSRIQGHPLGTEFQASLGYVWPSLTKAKHPDQCGEGCDHGPRCPQRGQESQWRGEREVTQWDIRTYTSFPIGPLSFCSQGLCLFFFFSLAHMSIPHARNQAGVRNTARDYQCWHWNLKMFSHSLWTSLGTREYCQWITWWTRIIMHFCGILF